MSLKKEVLDRIDIEKCNTEEGWYSVCREAPRYSDNEYQVTWFGMDGSYNENEFLSLEKAQQYAVSISEYGGHSITLSDVEGNEYDF